MSRESQRPTWKTPCWACQRRSLPKPVKCQYIEQVIVGETFCQNLCVHIVAVVQDIKCFQILPTMAGRLRRRELGLWKNMSGGGDSQVPRPTFKSVGEPDYCSQRLPLSCPSTLRRKQQQQLTKTITIFDDETLATVTTCRGLWDKNNKQQLTKTRTTITYIQWWDDYNCYHLSRDFEGAFPPPPQGSLQQGVPLSPVEWVDVTVRRLFTVHLSGRLPQMVLVSSLCISKGMPS